ncbi:hypothetical protein KKC97_10575 [bacterium]|nr:hypothetical protein [bacterium]MBU1638096.1 hypothetical protein [bacterium]
MKKRNYGLWGLVAVGSVWGLCEAGLGMYLRGMCARTITGSVMTAVAILFISLSAAYSRKIIGPAIVLGVAIVFRLFDAYLLHLPVLHGAVINPIFGFVTEAIAFVLLFAVLDSSLMMKQHGRMVLGGLSALVAVNLFPLVGYVTTISACVYPGTAYPLSLYYAPIAVGLSLITCPVGMALGEKLAHYEARQTSWIKRPLWAHAAFPAVSAVSLAVMILMRVA